MELMRLQRIRSAILIELEFLNKISRDVHKYRPIIAKQ
jgi:hypothetical protein